MKDDFNLIKQPWDKKGWPGAPTWPSDWQGWPDWPETWDELSTEPMTEPTIQTDEEYYFMPPALETIQEHRLYLIMRNDMASMTPGRVAAQASHATSAFTKAAENIMEPYSHMEVGGHEKMLANDSKYRKTYYLNQGYEQWKNATTQNFGTAIVLGANISQIDEINNSLVAFSSTPGLGPSNSFFLFETIVDPTYPIKDGNVYHLLNIVTGMYVFCAVNSYAHETFGKLPLF